MKSPSREHHDMVQEPMDYISEKTGNPHKGLISRCTCSEEIQPFWIHQLTGDSVPHYECVNCGTWYCGTWDGTSCAGHKAN